MKNLTEVSISTGRLNIGTFRIATGFKRPIVEKTIRLIIETYFQKEVVNMFPVNWEQLEDENDTRVAVMFNDSSRILTLTTLS